MECCLKDWTIRTKFFNNTVEYCVVGNIFGSKKFLDGSQITTSPIIKINGNKIRTRSGSSYLLSGPPHPDFFEFLIHNHPTVPEPNQKLYNAQHPLHFLNI